ncbi:uncharacterized protein LOC101854311, partial [Aplysia californica]|uniref:Uncharacterized protein LOC101854311 n=1 Tax=Aplysia californica TaxID=6500 RepID=A0ABM0JFX9_APLCA
MSSLYTTHRPCHLHKTLPPSPGRNCSDVNIVCENDGYITTVDGKCTCRCVPGLDPDTGCTTIIKSGTSTQEFPGGSYALPEPKDGCSGASVSSGTRIHYNDGDNSVSSDYDLKGGVSGTQVEHNFCVTQNSASEDKWPAGNYCIYRKGGSCPENFNEAYVQYDDTPTAENSNSVSGSFPDGDFGNNTRFQYCCRDNGFVWEPIFLPNRNPFVLIRYYDDYCQEVRGMHSYTQKMTITNSEDEGIEGYEGDVPLTDVSGRSYETTFCYYKPAMIDCGEVIQLTKENPTVTFSAPEGSEMDCTWLLKAPEDESIRLKFDSFKIAGSSGNCEDTLEIRYFRPGQGGFIFCGDTMDRTIQSVNNTIMLHLSTYGSTDSGFTATATLSLDEDLCYDAEDRGTSYVGFVNFTRFFEPCLPWAETTHCSHHPYNVQSTRSNLLLEGNYCRNPDYDTGLMPWCYTKADQCERNYCDPCMLGTAYDNDENCARKSEIGLCSLSGYEDEARFQCAKTCEVDLPAVSDKASDVKCGNPGDVIDGSIVSGGNQSSYNLGATVTYKCDTSDVTMDKICLTSGQWSDLGFVCDVCPHGWSLDLASGQCYKYFDSSVQLSDAKEACGALGGALPTAKTEAENTILYNLISNTIWLPMTDEVTEGTWVWSDGDVAVWTNWDSDQPDNWSTGEHCATMRTNGKWNDIPCSYNAHYVCAKPMSELPVCVDFWDSCASHYEANPSICEMYTEFSLRICPYTCGKCGVETTLECSVEPPPTNGKSSTNDNTVSRGATVEYSCNDGYVIKSGDSRRGCLGNGQLSGEPLRCIEGCPDGWVYSKSTSSCYGYFDEQVNYETAQTKCQEKQGTLAMPTTETEQALVLEARNSSHYAWIGLDDLSEEGIFVWADGTPLLGWSTWNSNEPNDWGGYEECGHLVSSGNWNDIVCWATMRYICQVSLTVFNPESNTTTPTTTTEKPTTIKSTTTTTTTAKPTTSTAGPTTDMFCPDGWSMDLTSDQCFKYFDSSVQLSDAREACGALGGALPTAKTEAENTILYNLISDTIWLPMTDLATEGTWVWSDGDEAVWTNWDTDQP